MTFNKRLQRGDKGRYQELPYSECVRRSVYMRLFRAWMDEYPYIMPEGDIALADALVEQGHAIQPTPGVYELTHEGRVAWAEMCRFLCGRLSDQESGTWARIGELLQENVKVRKTRKRGTPNA